jgi:bifunctional DNA-binding transcriptional regulator/antitoxin component of YhaV-PrlF toxin-antitoxin module
MYVLDMDQTLVTVVTERGQTSIPAALRRRNRIKAGVKLRWQQVSETEFRVQALTASPPNIKAMVGYAKRFHPADKRGSDEILRELREGDQD